MASVPMTRCVTARLGAYLPANYRPAATPIRMSNLRKRLHGRWLAVSHRRERPHTLALIHTPREAQNLRTSWWRPRVAPKRLGSNAGNYVVWQPITDSGWVETGRRGPLPHQAVGLQQAGRHPVTGVGGVTAYRTRRIPRSPVPPGPARFVCCRCFFCARVPADALHRRCQVLTWPY